MSGTDRYREQVERSPVPIFAWAGWLDAGTSQGVLNRFVNGSNPQIVVIGPQDSGNTIDVRNIKVRPLRAYTRGPVSFSYFRRTSSVPLTGTSHTVPL